MSFKRAFACLYDTSTSFVLNYKRLIPNPPITINGHVAVTTKATYQVNRKQIKHENINPSAASTATPKLSVVSPFKALMSSVKILVRIPGARVFLSYHPTFLLSNDLKSLTLKSVGEIFSTNSKT